jgi:hypothetical protein
MGPVKLLPGRLVVQLRRRPGRPPRRPLGLIHQRVEPRGLEVEPHPVPRLQQRQPPPTAASGEALRIEGLSEVPDCRPSPTVGRWFTPARISASGGCMFTTSAEPG